MIAYFIPSPLVGGCGCYWLALQPIHLALDIARFDDILVVGTDPGAVVQVEQRLHGHDQCEPGRVWVRRGCGHPG